MAHYQTHNSCLHSIRLIKPSTSDQVWVFYIRRVHRWWRRRIGTDQKSLNNLLGIGHSIQWATFVSVAPSLQFFLDRIILNAEVEICEQIPSVKHFVSSMFHLNKARKSNDGLRPWDHRPDQTTSELLRGGKSKCGNNVLNYSGITITWNVNEGQNSCCSYCSSSSFSFG